MEKNEVEGEKDGDKKFYIKDFLGVKFVAC